MESRQIGIVKYYSSVNGLGTLTKLGEKGRNQIDIAVRKVNINDTQLSKSDLVLYTESTTDQFGTVEATQVQCILEEQKLNFFETIFSCNYEYSNEIVNNLVDTYSNIDSEKLLSLIEYLLKEQSSNPIYLKNYLAFVEVLNSRHTTLNLTAFFANLVKISNHDFKSGYFIKGYLTFQQWLLVNGIESIDTYDDFNRVVLLVDKDHHTRFYQKLTRHAIPVSTENKFRFWYHGFTDDVDVHSLAARIANQGELDNLDNDQSENFWKYIDKLNPRQHQEFCDAIFPDFTLIKSTDTFIFQIIDQVKEKNRPWLNDLCNRIRAYSSDHIRLRLWLHDYSEEFQYEVFKPLVIRLSHDEQIRFIKKIFYLSKIGNLNLTVEILKELRESFLNFDYKDTKDYNINLSICIVLQLVIDIATKKQRTDDKEIYQIIASLVYNPKGTLKITSFFDSCRGRTIYNKQSNRTENLIDVPDFIDYCDGRLASTICEKSGLKFWWCQNSKCYSACRSTHEDFNQYTLKDFLEILQIEYSDDEYGILLGYINKINRFLAHLNCRGCGSVLMPKGQSNYGFYRVSRFHCPDKYCSTHNDEVYLTHCLNGNCPQVIDSRDCIKCIPEGVDNNCGWYICNFCNSCCSTDKIKHRIEIYKANGSEYKCHHKGHADLNQICCTSCGTVMDALESSSEKYNSILERLKILAAKKSNSIINSQQRKSDNRWTFRLRAPSNPIEFAIFKKKLLLYKATGFIVNDIKEKRLEYEVSESYNKDAYTEPLIFTCAKCDSILDLTEDKYKQTVFKTYRNKFKKDVASSP